MSLSFSSSVVLDNDFATDGGFADVYFSPRVTSYWFVLSTIGITELPARVVHKAECRHDGSNPLRRACRFAAAAQLGACYRLGV